ncbi:MAG: RNA methyltransferase [Ignavibacteriae bacterium]|nr:RNA methyltransferase [Ignavibacteriota bacterium]
MTNEKLKLYSKLKQKKYREENKQFLIEGIHLIEECLKSKYYKKNIVEIFLRKDFENEKILNKLKNVEFEYLSDTDYKKLTETENSQGIIGLVHNQENLPFLGSKIICALDNINDPGNLGTILRICWWFGVENILISKNSADIYNSKVIRASQGALFNLQIKDNIDLSEELKNLHNRKYEIVITDLDTKNSLENYKFDYNKNYVIVFGNEANGISKEIKEVKEYNRIKIDSYAGCESLNVAASAAIILFEIRKSIK